MNQQGVVGGAHTGAAIGPVASDGKLSELQWCRGCEEEVVRSPAAYCEFCGLLKAALDRKYDARGRMRLADLPLPRVDAGVIDIGSRRAPNHDTHDTDDTDDTAETARNRGSAVAAAAALLCAGAAAFCLLGWFGLRLIVAAGLQMVQR